MGQGESGVSLVIGLSTQFLRLGVASERGFARARRCPATPTRSGSRRGSGLRPSDGRGVSWKQRWMGFFGRIGF